jgi:YfiH family protein
MPGLTVTALAADCAPVLFADAEARVVAAAHAGWKGALAGILEATVAEMVAAGALRERIVAAIGPCIGQASYEIGPDMRDRFAPGDERYFVPGRADRLHFDLAGYCASRLRSVGLTSIDVIGADTCADETRFFSNRRAFLRGEPDYGRNLSAICIVA